MDEGVHHSHLVQGGVCLNPNAQLLHFRPLVAILPKSTVFATVAVVRGDRQG